MKRVLRLAACAVALAGSIASPASANIVGSFLGVALVAAGAEDAIDGAAASTQSDPNDSAPADAGED